ncbi:MAG: response regulator [Bacteroidota bacterium]|nr:response regulator [Bacteroidota bacterium]
MMKSNILIVDDSETNLVLLEAILEDADFDVKTAYSTKEAEKVLKSYTPQLILLDLLMPNENGFDLLRKLKSHNDLKVIPIIIVTAFANNENKVIAKDLGAEDIIEKPINIPDFLERVCKVLGINK